MRIGAECLVGDSISEHVIIVIFILCLKCMSSNDFSLHGSCYYMLYWIYTMCTLNSVAMCGGLMKRIECDSLCQATN